MWWKKGHTKWKKGKPGWNKIAIYKTIVEDILNSDEEFLDVVRQEDPDEFDTLEFALCERDSSTEDFPAFTFGKCRLCGDRMPNIAATIAACGHENKSVGMTCLKCLEKISEQILGREKYARI